MSKTNIFSLLVVDTFEYVMGMKGIDFDIELYDALPSGVKPVFNEVFGDAVISYYIRHEQEIKEITKDLSLSNEDEISVSATEAFYKIIKDDCFLMDIIRVFALFVDIAISCQKQGNVHLLPAVIDYLTGFYQTHLSQALTILGGYKSLFIFSQQYYEYYNSDLEKKIDATRFKGEQTLTSSTEKEMLTKYTNNNDLSMKNANEIAKESKVHSNCGDGDIASILKRALEQDCIAAILAKYNNSNTESPSKTGC